jgi:hypothetical protein
VRTDDANRSRREMGERELAIRRAFLSAARTGGADLDEFAARLTLADPEVDADGLATRLLADQIALQYERGWQPADLAHVVRRDGSPRIARLAVDVVLTEAMLTRAVERAPDEWVAQLRAMATGRPTPPTAVHRWRRRENLGTLDAWADVLRLADILAGYGRMENLLPPPSRWGDAGTARTETVPRTSDGRTLARIRALLAKAESTEFPEEAEAFAAKAQELMTRHAIEAAMLAETHVGEPLTGIRARRVHLDNPYAREKLSLLTVVGDVNSVRAIWMESAGIATIVGDPDDLESVDLLFTSLLVQAMHALTSTGRAGGQHSRSPRFRRGFLTAYAARIGERLETARQAAATEAGRETGRDFLPVLAARDRAVDEAVAELFPTVKKMRSRTVDAGGWYAGRAAADAADLGSRRRQVSG